MKTILFLFGGVSSEYAVSLESAQRCSPISTKVNSAR